MILNKFENIGISAVSAAVSSKYVNVEEYISYTTDIEINKFKKMTGIMGRYDVGIKQTSSDLCFSAAKNIINRNSFKEEEIGVLVYVTQTPDYRTPSTAYQLHKRLSLSKNCISFDVNLGCSGFVYGSTILASLIATSNINKGLLLIGDTNAKERVLEDKPQNNNTDMLFGDAGAALMFEKKTKSCISTSLCSDGSGYKSLIKPYNAWKHPIGPEKYPSDDIAVFNFTLNEVPSLINEFLRSECKSLENFDDLVLHQANLYVIKQIAKKMNVSFDKVPISIDVFGNTSGASIPLTLVKKYGDINKNKELNLLMSGFGIGLSWGVMSAQINVNDILPLIHTDEYFDDGIPD